MPSIDELRVLQNLPLEIKIQKSKARIREWINNFGESGVYVSFSGGKDSTVLLDLVRSEFPNVEAVFIDTGLEYPEIKDFVKSYNNITIIKPKISFKKVIENHGYPIITKEVSQKISYAKKGSEWALKYIQGSAVDNSGNKSKYAIADKWRGLVDAPFDVSSYCCTVMKKRPAHRYSIDSGKVEIVGTLCEESLLRTTNWIKTGCNAFNNKIPRSAPLSFWTEQDILNYIYNNKLTIASVYGEVKKTNDEKYYTTGVKRTGCIYCGFGVHLDKYPNRYQQLYKTHPKLWQYCMKPKEQGGLGFQDVMDYIGVDTKPKNSLF